MPAIPHRSGSTFGGEKTKTIIGDNVNISKIKRDFFINNYTKLKLICFKQIN